MFERCAGRRVHTHPDEAADEDVARKASRAGAGDFRSHLNLFGLVTGLLEGHGEIGLARDFPGAGRCGA